MNGNRFSTPVAPVITVIDAAEPVVEPMAIRLAVPSAPSRLSTNCTVPVGAVLAVGAVSVTVAVMVTGVPKVVGPGGLNEITVLVASWARAD